MMEVSHHVPDGWGLCPDWFPVYPLCMVLAFAAAFAGYRYNARGAARPSEHLLPIVIAAFLGGVLGAKLPIVILNLRYGLQWQTLLAGRTIVGGLVGGTLAVLLLKWRLGIRGRYGNLLAAPLALGMAVGRLGCLLGGCCFGTPTDLPWGIDFGDGVSRHPTQAYELLFCLGAFLVLQRARHSAPPGRLLTRFLLAYFGFRFVEEFVRPHPVLAGLTTFQWICVAGVLILLTKERVMQAREAKP